MKIKISIYGTASEKKIAFSSMVLAVFILSFAEPVIAKDSVYLFNELSIKDMQPHTISFHASNGCRYSGNSKSIDSSGAITLTKKSCNGITQNISRKAYIIELKRAVSVIPLVPAGSTWIFRKRLKK